MTKQPFNKTFLFILKHSFVLLMLNILISCTDKEKNSICEEDDTPSQKYLLTDYQQNEYPVILKKCSISFQNIKSSLLIVHLFDHTKNMTQTQVALLTKIQEQFKNNLTIKHITTDNASNPENIAFFEQLKKYFKLKKTNNLPLMVFYKNNRYYTHIQGKMPIEILRHTVQKILKK